MAEENSTGLGIHRHVVHYQIGAPALIYRERMDLHTSFLHLSGDKYSNIDADMIRDSVQRQNRVKSRWNFSADLGKIEKVRVLRSKRKQRVSGMSSTQHDNASTPMDVETTRYNDDLQMKRFGMLIQHDIYAEAEHHQLLKNYETYDRPYIDAELLINRDRGRNLTIREPKLDATKSILTRQFQMQHRNCSNPAYLAPFYLDSILADQSPALPVDTVARTKTETFAPRPPQGNCLLCMPCPCPVCAQRVDEPSQQSWCLFHPKGHLMDTLCVSNLILPNGAENAGHIFSVSKWANFKKKEAMRSAQATFPNEICLDETILDIQQSGTWDSAHRECTFVVRTSTHISVLEARLCKPELHYLKSDFDEGLCWGCYALEEKERIDLRSLVPSAVSYRPASLACHPKYGNSLSSAMFAFLSIAEHSGAQNTIHHRHVGSTEGPIAHPIVSVRHISSIDFTSTHPMCLWSAAASHVRPALVSDIQFTKEAALGFGTSLYTLDLRINSSTFQWSPSAQEMTTEGVHSINGILTDWERDHVVWVTSRSAGKTWEIDGRMPCRAVNSWSLSSACEDDSVYFSQKGPYGENIILTKTMKQNSNNACGRGASPLLQMDSAPTTFGFHVFQPPSRKPRLQTGSMECIATPNLDLNETNSIAPSALFAQPEVSDDSYACGVAGFRTPLSSFVPNDCNHLTTFCDGALGILCTLTMTNKGDIFCHSLLESAEHVKRCRSFPDLPVGVRAIPLPVELDGTTKAIEHKRWKPTGGMNLKIFFSNRYPTRRDALQCIKPGATSKIRIAKKRKESHPSPRGDQDNRVYHVRTKQPGISPAGLEPDSLSKEGNPIAIPLSLAEGKKKTQHFFEPDFSEAAGMKERPVTDLTTKMIKDASEMWDMWDQFDGFSSDQDNETKGFV